MKRMIGSFGPPPGLPSVTATHRACLALANQIKGGASFGWFKDRSFYNPEIPRAMRRAVRSQYGRKSSKT